jgi:hypothetical protein
MLTQKLAIAFSILGGSMAVAQSIVHQPVNSNGVTPIHTALDHISIVALPEKITRVAAGSDAMQIEWHDNNVFIKPIKSGQSTNLMVWTEHQFSTYELESPGDVQAMTFVLDETKSPLPQSAASEAALQATPSPEQVRRITDSVISSAMLEATPVVPRGVRPAKDYVSVMIKDVVRNGNSVYVRFAVTNNSKHPYRVVAPTVFAMAPSQKTDLLTSMKNLQISEQATGQFQLSSSGQVMVRATALAQKDIAPRTTAEGVLTLDPAGIDKVGIYEFLFGNDGKHPIQAMAVL